MATSASLQAEEADRLVRSIEHQMHSTKYPVHRDLAGFDFEASCVDRTLINQIHSPGESYFIPTALPKPIGFACHPNNNR